MSQSEDQHFLNVALREAQGDNDAQKLVLLDYEQALYTALQSFQLCSNDAHLDLTLLRKRVARFIATTQRYRATLAVIPMQCVMDLIADSETLLGDIAQFCTTCQCKIQRAILANFRALHTLSITHECRTRQPPNDKGNA